jgi:energy-converting hydrogenase Eha subunit G
MGPELPFLGAGAVAIVGATVRDGKLPGLTRPLLGIMALVLVASATTDTRLAPVVRAFGLLVFLVAVMTTTRVILARKSSPITVGIHKNT